MPTAASASATTANAANSSVLNRCGATDASTTLCNDWNCPNAWSLSTSHTARRTAGTSEVGPADECRTKVNEIGSVLWLYGTYTSGVGCPSRPNCLTSLTMPTICRCSPRLSLT